MKLAFSGSKPLDLKLGMMGSSKFLPENPKKEKIIVIMGATGSGKSRLSIDLATRFSPCEIINSDKMQLYRGLDITTNKIPMHERLGIPHHLIDEFDPADGELSASDFRSLAASAVSEISSRNHLPILVGGSNSFIHAFLTDQFESDSDGSSSSLDSFESVSAELRYDCCFIWIDVSLPVLKEYLSLRVDQMLESGMFEELAEFYESESSITNSDIASAHRIGIRKSIGVAEFQRFFRFFPPPRMGLSGGKGCIGSGEMMGLMEDTRLEADVSRRMLFEEAVQAIKDNSYELAKRQVGKIKRLRSAGWDIKRLNATEVFRAVLMDPGRKSSDIWEKEIVESSVKFVKQFLLSL
ncbi:tRNA isopentenyltransferase [Macleaya cordata]|uniref:tRNA isopentenyltransferase n=1 Tax=Macleaya cordata TaxID=56857 RepID=A0A200QN02_MACCD|nr:tRNA isopentenyltransferase [Macleaya cordata]